MTNGGRSGLAFVRCVVGRRAFLSGVLFFLLLLSCRCCCCCAWRSGSAGDEGDLQLSASSQLKTSAKATPVRGAATADEGSRGARTATVTVCTGGGSEMETCRWFRRPTDSLRCAEGRRRSDSRRDMVFLFGGQGCVGRGWDGIRVVDGVGERSTSAKKIEVTDKLTR